MGQLNPRAIDPVKQQEVIPAGLVHDVGGEGCHRAVSAEYCLIG